MFAMLRNALSLVLVCLLTAHLQADGEIRVLLVHGSPVPRGIDPTLKQKLADAGFVTRSARYEQLSEDLLGAFHVVVVMQEPAYGQSFVGDRERQIYRQKVPFLLQFVREGGGLYITHDANINPQRQDCNLINETLLAPLDAEVLPETVVDEATLTSHVARLLQMCYCSTREVATHPITAGVREIWYPCGPVKFGRDTSPVRVGSEWQVVLWGNKTAISGGSGGETASGEPVSYRHAPPLAAVRSYGKGRVFLFPSAARCWFHSAYHRELGGFVLAKGDGFRLVVQALRWLAEPRLRARLAPLPPESPSHPRGRPARQEVDPALVEELLSAETEFRPFLGLVGLDLSGGNVAEYCEAARAAGFAFVAFAVDAAKLDSGSFSRLVEDCRQQTDKHFVALPGARFTTKWGTNWLGLDLLRWPRQEEIDGWSVGSFAMRGITRLYAPTLGHHRGGYPPFGLRFWNAIDAVASVRGEIVDDSLDWYRYCAANFCVVVPVASQRALRPADLAAGVRWKVGVFARDPGEIRAALSQGVRRVFITEGPVIRQFSVLNLDSPPAHLRWQQGAGWQRGDRLVLKIDVAGDRPLREVKLYQGRELFRCFRPSDREFQDLVRVEATRDASFWLEIEDAEGHRALSAPILVLNRFKRFNWCTDHQNLINWEYDPLEDRRGNFKDGLYGLHVIHSPGGGDALGANLPGHEWGDMPPGREVGPQGAKFRAVVPFPKFIGKDGRPVERVRARPELRFNSEDCYVLDLRWDGDSRTPGAPDGARFYECLARLVNPRGKPYTPNFWLIETETKILRDITLGDVEGPEQIFFEAMFLPGRLNKWPSFLMLAPKGKLRGRTAFAAGKVTLPAAPLARRGYVALLPNYWYCPAVFVLDEHEYVARIANAFGGNVLLGVESPRAVLRAGTRLKHRFLYAVVAGPDTREEAFERIYRAYGFSGAPAYDVQLDEGVVLDTTFALTLRAEERAVAGSLRIDDLPSGLLVQIDGLCPNWDAGILDTESGKLRRFGILDGRGYLTLHGPLNMRFAAGNLLICDHEGVRLHLRQSKSGWLVEAHNPTASVVTTTIRAPQWLNIAPPFSNAVTLRPGDTRTFPLKESDEKPRSQDNRNADGMPQ